MGFFKNFFERLSAPKEEKEIQLPISTDLEENINYMLAQFSHTDDLKQRPFHYLEHQGVILYLETLIDEKRIQKEILKPFAESREGKVEEILTSVYVKKDFHLNPLADALLQGNGVIFFHGFSTAYIVNINQVLKRSVTEPDNEGVVRGAHHGFIESLNANLYLIRERLQNKNLVFKYYQLGREGITRVAVAYVKDLANPELVEEVDRRIRAIDADFITSPGNLLEYMEDSPWSPFPQTLYTERPDRVVANLMEGRVVILAEGDPTAQIVPVTLFAFYQTPDDYNTRWIVGSFIRVIRLASFLIAFILPGLYIAVVGFHPEMMPNELLFSVKSSIEKIPFPPILEALFMELAFELIREAGIRLPSRVGQTIGIVGGLVIGDAVVSAGLVSLPMVIVVAVTAISSFVVPSHEMSTAVRILRFPLMVMAAIFGLVGITFGLAIVLIHLCTLESFGTPYLAPFAPLRIRDLKDTFVRFPAWKLNQRPHDPKPQRYKQEWHSRGWEEDEQTN